MILLCLALYACISHFGYIKSYSVCIYTAFCISCLSSPLCKCIFFFSIEQLNFFKLDNSIALSWKIESSFCHLYARTNPMLETIFVQSQFQHAQLENFPLYANSHTALQIILIGCEFVYLLSLCKAGLRHVGNLG